MADLTLRGQQEEAQQLVNAGDYVGAADICRRIVRAFPKSVATYALLGQAYLGLGEHSDAANLFRRVLGADPEHALAYASLGAIYAERGLLDEAIWQMERAWELSPRNGEMRRELAALYAQRSDAPPGRVKPTRGLLARGYLRGLLYPKAIGELREIIAAEPARYDLRVALALALWRDRRPEAAVVVCQGLLGELPNCLVANLLLGRLWLNTERDEEGRVLLQRCQVLDPDNQMAQSVLGAQSPLPLRVSRLPLDDQALPPLELPYSLDDDATVTPGRAALRPGDANSDDAGVVWLAEHPDDWGARLGLARRYGDLGELDTAIAQYRYLLERHPAAQEAVTRDLERLVGLYPARRGLVALLQVARARPAQSG